MRALLIVLDSVGIGGAPDAAAYGDEGADTLGHIFEQIPGLRLPTLASLGLGQVVTAADRSRFGSDGGRASYGKMQEQSAGKDTTTGHWELAGAILHQPFTVFDTFPDELVRSIERHAGIRFIGNYACSGTEILDRLGPEHLHTASPILYTSADSVLQIAAHESVIPIEKLYAICEIARRHADTCRIGRVIARPFEGEPGNFRRTTRRHDYSMRPPRTVLDAIAMTGQPVIGVGKIKDIFAGQGIMESYPTTSNTDGMSEIEKLWGKTPNGLIFANLVDFDMVYGHRRDVGGYAKALVEFDDWLAHFIDSITPEDLVIITADHGNDPTFHGTDHTREQVPLFVMHQRQSRDLGTRSSYADVAASLGAFFKLPAWPVGTSFIG
ncbi:MAG: phosphopentomutase [Chthoniobacterales bacterium]